MEQEEVVPRSEKPTPIKAAAPDDPEAAKPLSTIPFEFHGSGSEYFKIWLVNLILTIITIGIYSPWAKVRRKQYFYGNTRLQGGVFEYPADPVKILKGRAIVFGIAVVYSVLSEFVPILGAILGLSFLAILPWVIVRSLAFNARNSALRNVRFGFHGKVTEAGEVFIWWPFVAVLTLGALFPYVYFRQKKFIVENFTYGRTRFTFTATRRDYYRLFFSSLIPIFIAVVVTAGFGFLFAPLAILAGLLFYLYLLAFFSVKSTNLLYNSSKIADHRLESTMKISEYIVIVITNSLATALTLGLYFPWAKVRTLRYRLKNLVLISRGDLDGFTAAEKEQISALGEEAGDFLDFDFGL